MNWFRQAHLGTVAVAMLALLSAASALAQVRPAYTKNIDEPGRTPYSISIDYSRLGCSGVNCVDSATWGKIVFIDGPLVPAGKRLVVQWVSGDVPANSNGILFGVQTSRVVANQLVVWQYAGPFHVASPGSAVHSFGTPAFFTVEPGRSPHFRIFIDDAANTIQSFSYTGYLIDAAN
jgi:hypothetical protein